MSSYGSGNPDGKYGAKAHTQNFDRLAHYGTLAEQKAKKDEELQQSCGRRTVRALLVMINAILFCGGLLVLILGLVVDGGTEQQIISKEGANLALIIKISGGVLMGVAVLGWVAGRTASRFVVGFYVLVMLVFTVVLAVVTVVLLVFVKSGKMKDKAETLWVQNVSENPQLLCTWQAAWKCSGFTSFCNGTDVTTMPTDCPKCQSQESMQYPEGCWTKLQETVEHNFFMLTICICTALTLVLLGLVMSCTLCKRVRMQDSEKELMRRLTPKP
eukprot:TRINITY_DN9822_c0_g1_i1.p2 TRINITY_DN9822_c0_g1~~TRINITY_DN9822_c0_g1_i1.p2  ORF type:complete len:272 (-),score=72.91 TRINITY_DN9822_c0_g1_i1:171-986(-)